MAVAWCVGSIIFGLLLIAAGIGLKVKMDIPYIGTISGSLGAVLMVMGFAGGILGFCII